ncbi:hypothetical protein [uncultured Acetobacteroides sp.]|uniref:hypothetical protein n=1 Tax=uncultured Acetobacteroides sp. TaxID=1760811 RepID=UPI0029F5B6BA|nr:hypothetical protein [uncultured Acetobacteroides sp.]
MKRYLYVLLLGASMAASCAKDGSSPSGFGTESGMQAKDIVGTWTFETPKDEDIVVKATSDDFTKLVKQDLTTMMNGGVLSYIMFDITFDGSQYCSAVNNATDPKARYQGAYIVSGGRLNAVLNSPKDNKSIYGKLEMSADSTRYLVFDKDAYIESWAQQLKSQDPTGTVSDLTKKAVELMRTSITELRYPVKLVRKDIQ